MKQRLLFTRKLKEAVESKLGYDLNTPRDFESCRATVFDLLHENISVSTLKRMWGYVSQPNDYKPSIHTLDTLSQFVDYECFMTFCSACRENNSASKADIRFLVESISDSINKVEGELEQLKKIIEE